MFEIVMTKYIGIKVSFFFVFIVKLKTADDIHNIFIGFLIT